MAEASIIPLTDWPDGVVLPKGSHLQESPNAIRAIANAVGLDLRRPRRPIPDDWRLAVIVNTGPNGEGDYTDERYFCAIQAITDTDPTDTLQVEDDFQDGFLNDAGNPTNIVTATNLEEWLVGSHGLVVNFPVLLKGKADNGNPQKTHWMFSANATNLFIVNVQKDGGSDGTKLAPASWTYTVRRLGITIGTTVGLARPRPNGSMIYQAGSSGFGLAFYGSDQQLYLWDAGEIENTNPACP